MESKTRLLETLFDPVVAGWFAERFGEPTPPQRAGWAEIAAGRDTLIAAPTGSGKTLAAFLWAIDRLVRVARTGWLDDRTRVLYVSPLKALGNDIRRNLEEPLAAIRARAVATGRACPAIRVAVRSGDTPASERQAMVKRPPHVLITTPESLYILLTAERSRRVLATVETVIVDEIHAVAGDKRGAHLALSLERLDALLGRPVQRIGLSATQKPIAEIARLLVGAGREAADGAPRCAIVDTGHRRAMELMVETTDLELGPMATHELWAAVYDRIAAHVQAHRTTIVFVNTRRLVERVAHALSARLGDERVVAHHGSLARRIRLAAEQKLKSGEVPVIVATASLELGIDVGHVDLVCHIGAPRALATLLQRVGRSGHWLGSVPKGIFFPLTRDELMQTAAAVRAIRAGELDEIHPPRKPLDVLAQQMVAIAAADDVHQVALWELVRRAQPYRDLTRPEFDAVLEMLAEGVATRRGRRSAHLHYDRIHGRLRGRRGARLAAITGGGAIPDTADYEVVEDPSGAIVGKVNEDFAIESMAGDIFLLGNHSWRIRRVESAGRLRVEDAGQLPPTIPFWLGEAPPRTTELSQAVADLRAAIAARLAPPERRCDRSAEAAAQPSASPAPSPEIVSAAPVVASMADDESLPAWLIAECGLERGGAEQLVDYVRATLAVLGTVPTSSCVVAERFFDESGGMQLVLHAPFGGAVNRAWGLALRKRFCVTFDFELQAAATDDGIVISLGEQHSFPLDSVFAMVHPATLEHDLVQAVLAAPMFGTRWRWNASRALALQRHANGQRVPMQIQRMRAEDLLAAVFPAQVACGDNHSGPIEPPSHPLVDETIANCLHEAMDLDGLRAVLDRIRSGAIRAVAVETPAPSVMAHEILNANPYAFLDDAPLEERRARAVSLRRTDPDLAGGIGALDAEAIVAVRAQAWPDVREADELHDALLSVILLPLDDLGPWLGFADELRRSGRAVVAEWHVDGAARRALVATERVALARAALPAARLELPHDLVARSFMERDAVDADAAFTAIVRGWLECTGPVTVPALAARLGLRAADVAAALARLESEGIVLRGSFTPGETAGEWCERRLLARIHHLTVGRLRREIDPVTPADFMRFLFRWQHVAPGTRLHGRDGLATIVTQLHGLELPAPSWERSVLPARVERYDPALLDELCFAGVVAWGRFSPIAELAPGARPRRRTAPTRVAPLALALRDALGPLLAARGAAASGAPAAPDAGALALAATSPTGGVAAGPRLSPAARQVLAVLQSDGASFLGDIASATGLDAVTAEEALWELVARGLVTGDGFAGLRTLLAPPEPASPERRLRALRGGRAPRRALPVGRWALLRGRTAALGEDAVAEHAAQALLRRWGVVMRELLARETLAPPWRTLLGVFRRMEARGEVRGGRFVAGFVGEQFALPEAVEALRAVRRQAADDDVATIAAADPLNLVGIVTPGARVSPLSTQVIAYARGVPLEAGDAETVARRIPAASLAAPARA